MTWELFYLICFAVGFTFSVVSFLSGAFHVHVPKFMHLGGHGFGHGHVGIGHGQAGVGHAPVAGHAPAGAAHGHSGPPKAIVKTGTHGPHFSFFNPLTSAAFLTWFGGTGYLLVHLRHIWVFAGLVLSTGAGLAGASVVFWFVGKVLMANERSLDPLDYEMVGILGRISSSVRADGTGEIIFDQEGVRKACAARCEDGEALAKGVEVVVTRFERGVAYVRPWDEFSDSSARTIKQEQTRE